VNIPSWRSKRADPEGRNRPSLLTGRSGGASRSEREPGIYVSRVLEELRHNPLLWLLVFVPVLFASQELAPEAHTLLFVLSLLAIVPLAVLLSHATESVAAKTGDAVGGLLNATLGNLTELVIALAALRAGQYLLVKASIAGAIVTNILRRYATVRAATHERNVDGVAVGVRADGADLRHGSRVPKDRRARYRSHPTSCRLQHRRSPPMLEAVEATIEPDGTVRLHEPVRLAGARRALVIILEDGTSTVETAMLSERALAVDWNRKEEDAAWAHLQRGR
jgi:hypothetical protein